MKKILIVLLSFFAIISSVYAQDKLTLAGTVIGEDGYELIGVAIAVKGNETLGTITDIDGKFRLTGIPKNSIVTVSLTFALD